MSNAYGSILPETAMSRESVIVITDSENDSATYVVNRNNVIEILDESCSNTIDSAQDVSVIEVDDSSDDEASQRETSRSMRSLRSGTNIKQINQTINVTDKRDKQIIPVNPCKPGYKCAICLESLLQEQRLSVIPCGHVFCTHCITPMCRGYKQQSSCPKCRRNFQMHHLKTIFF